jgi:hypothetical protein
MSLLAEQLALSVPLAIDVGGWIGVIVGIVGLVAWIWMLVDVIGRDDLSGGVKALWIIFGIFFPLITVLVYLLVGRR